MGRPSIGQMERSFRALTVGVIRDRTSAGVARVREGLTEREEQIHIEISGTTGTDGNITWASKELEFETIFVDATGQRDSELDRPNFNYGVYIPRGGPIAVVANVTDWDVSPRLETIGCTLAIGILPSDVSSRFSGELHAVFQGYGAPADVYGDMDATDAG